ncbi:MAG: hypothetical protein B7733_02765 [Myxococcales bacterium FL481]|nr:MAG: hypothetical protein B7733_02765 [Myxococcales bacterium FL481]
MTPRSRIGLWVALALLAASALYASAGFRVVTEITHFLPDTSAQADASVTREITSSELSRTMILLVESPHAATSLAASRALEGRLRQDPRIADNLAFLEGGPPKQIDRAIWELYQPRRLSFVASTVDEAKRRLEPAELQATLADLRQRLALPLSPLLTKVAPEDPLLTIPRLYDRLQAQRADGISVVDGRFATASGRGAVLFLGTRASAFAAPEQRALLAALDDHFQAVRDRFPDVSLAKTGVNRHATAAEAGIKQDITRVSLASVVAIVSLFTLLFRSPRFVAGVTLPIGAGMLAGLAVCLAWFGQIHSLTLAFGAGLIGVSIDYAIHLYCHHCLDPQRRGPHAALRRTWPGLGLGALTTITGFLALGATSFRGLREIAVFASVGIFAALLSTKLVLPYLLPRTVRPTAALATLAARLERLTARLARQPRRSWALLLAVALYVGFGLPRTQWHDDMASLQSLDPQLVAEDEHVFGQVVRFEQRRFALAIGVDDETALAVNDRVAAALEQGRTAGELGGFRNLAGLLPSAGTQRDVRDAVLATPDLWPRMRSALEQQGFRAEMFEPFRAALKAPAPTPLTYAQLAASPLAPLVRPFRIELDGRVAFLSFLSDVRDSSAVANRLARIPGARLFDQASIMHDAYEAYRERTARLLALGLVAVLAVVLVRYRNIRMTAAAIVPALAAAFVTLGTLGFAGVTLSILHLTALLMVLSIGVDYGVFLVESRRGDEALGPTLCSLFVACLSTVFGFGLLAVSDHPALRSLGLTACIGVVVSLLLAPVSLTLARHVETT